MNLRMERLASSYRSRYLTLLTGQIPGLILEACGKQESSRREPTRGIFGRLSKDRRRFGWAIVRNNIPLGQGGRMAILLCRNCLGGLSGWGDVEAFQRGLRKVVFEIEAGVMLESLVPILNM